MEALIKKWQGEEVLIRHDAEANAWIIIAIHSTVLGPGAGGTRMKPYRDLKEALEDAMRLSEGMTLKYAVSGFPRGGAKAVIAVPKGLADADRQALLRRYGGLVKQLGGLFYTGPDVGTSPLDMNVISDAGAPYIFCRTPECGGAGDSGPATALGVFSAIQAVCGQLYGTEALEGRSVLVQGVGSVGRRLVDLLINARAEVMFTDVDETAVRRLRDEIGLPFVAPEAVYDTECDIFSPCAYGGILNRGTIGRLKCRAVAGGANNQLAEPADGDRLQQRGILYAPDYAVNIGGAMAIIGMEAMGWSKAEADERVRGVKESLHRIFDLSAEQGITTDAAARRIAAKRLASGASAKGVVS
jgi:glutamate dehydrogenase/leucine dehydrogenase